MDPRMRNYMMNRDRNMVRRDERNPYGSKGGYVSSNRSDRRYDRNYDSRSYYGGEFSGMSDRNPYYDERDRRDYNDYNYMDIREDYRSYPMDNGYHDYGGGYLTNDEIYRWKNMLYSEMEKGECDILSDEKILKHAKDLGIKFDEFTEQEFIVTVLMMYTDYCKTIGKASMDVYLKLAKDFLDDKDAKVKYGEKLTSYYDNIVNV